MVSLPSGGGRDATQSHVPESDQAGAATRCLWGIYVILDRVLAGRPHIEIAREVIRGGARVIQLRDKHMARDELRPVARELRTMTRDHGVTLIINDDPQLAVEVDADGVHVGQEDMAATEARRIVGPEKIVGLSTHNLAQAQAAAALPVDYIGVGPIFPTRSKESLWPAVGVELVRKVRRATPLIITAIGGIREEHVRELVLAGAHNIAMIGEIMTAPDISGKVERLCRIYAQALAERCANGSCGK